MIRKLLYLLNIVKPKLKLYRVMFEYKPNVAVECIAWAKDEEDLYKVMHWTKDNVPKMQFKEITANTGCIYTVTKFTQ